MAEGSNDLGYYERVGQEFARLLEEGRAPWQRPFAQCPLPVNPLNGKRYNAINSLILAAEGRPDPRWFSADALQKVEGPVPSEGAFWDGEPGKQLVHWQYAETREVEGPDGTRTRVRYELEEPRQRLVEVFNAAQFSHLPAFKPVAASPERFKRVDALVDKLGVRIRRAPDSYYDAKKDRIGIPSPGVFENQDVYHYEVLRNLAAWASHPKRFPGRAPAKGGDVAPRYSLASELAAMLVGKELGLQVTPRTADTTAWRELCKNHPRELFIAASEAEQIADVLTGRTHLKQRTPELSRPASWTVPLAAMAGRMVGLKREDSSPNAASRSSVDDEASGFASSSRLTQDDRVEIRVAIRSLKLAATPDPAAGHVPEHGARASAEETSRARQSADISKERPMKRQPQRAQEAAAGKRRPGQESAAGGTGKQQQRHEPNPPRDDQAHLEHDKAVRGPSAGRPKLKVPYKDARLAWQMGARRDKAARRWYVPEGVDAKPLLDRWSPSRKDVRRAQRCTPREEFAEVLQAHGFVLGEEHPVMDDNLHQCSVKGDLAGSKSGSYGIYIEGGQVVAGSLHNGLTGEDVRWRPKGYRLSKAEANRLRAAARAKRVEYEKHRRESHERAASSARFTILRDPANYRPLEPTPYQRSKGLELQPGLSANVRKGLLVPLVDVNGKIWNVQRILANGDKHLEPGGRVHGCFHVVGGLERLEEAEVIAIAQGYATASTIADLAKQPAVAALAPENLLPVAQALAKRYPGKPIVVFADDDKHKERDPQVRENTSMRHAIEAANAVGGRVVRPVFAFGEQEPPTPTMKDFNDLANKSELGREGARSQIKGALEHAAKQRRDEEQERSRSLARSREADDKRARGRSREPRSAAR